MQQDVSQLYLLNHKATKMSRQQKTIVSTIHNSDMNVFLWHERDHNLFQQVDFLTASI